MGKLLTFMFLWNMVGALWLLPALASFLLPSQVPTRPPAAEPEQPQSTNATRGSQSC
jgi:hypothetical protein